MRAEDLKRLEVPIDAADTRGPTEQFLDALELGVPGARALVQAVFADLDPDRHGIGWWAEHVSTRRRILIGDQLYLAAAAIETNLAESKLHLLEAEDWFGRGARNPQMQVSARTEQRRVRRATS